MVHVPLLKVRYAIAFIHAAEAHGANGNKLLAGVGLRANVLEMPEAWMSYSQFAYLIEAAIAKTGCHTLGLEAGIAPRSSHSEFSKLTLRAPMLYQSLNRICANSSREDTSARFRLRQDGKHAWLKCGSIAATDEAVRQIETYRYAALVAVIRCAAGPDWLPAHANFQSTASEHVAHSALLSGVAVEFGQTELSIEIAPTLLGRAMSDVPDVPVRRSKYSQQPIEFVESLREVIRTGLLAGTANLDTTARTISLSRRTLQRTLSEYGLTYSQLLEEVKLELAKSWLEKDGKPIAEIACDLGYTYSTHFTRAFRRLSGFSPREYRDVIRGDVGEYHVSG